jgi:hypothetical protein
MYNFIESYKGGLTWIGSDRFSSIALQVHSIALQVHSIALQVHSIALQVHSIASRVFDNYAAKK